MMGIGVRIAIVLVGGSLLLLALYAFTGMRDGAAARHTFELHASELSARAFVPGSPLACLDALAGETVEVLCEQAIFASPAATAAAVSYAAAQLALLAEGSEHARRDPGFEAKVGHLRHAVEFDRFGLVAHVLALREGCTADKCRAFAFMNDTTRVSTNLSARTYDSYVRRQVNSWAVASPPLPAVADSGLAASFAASAGVSVPSPDPALPAAGAPGKVPTAGLKFPTADLFFPSSESIPPVNIMNAEPPGSKSQANAAADKGNATPDKANGAGDKEPATSAAKKSAPATKSARKAASAPAPAPAAASSPTSLSPPENPNSQPAGGPSLRSTLPPAVNAQ
jgi:hypothetical protein